MTNAFPTARTDYNSDNSIDLRLSDSEMTSLSMLLKERLAESGIRMSHETIVEGSEPLPTSHLGVTIALYRRIDAARHGRKTWNRGR